MSEIHHYTSIDTLELILKSQALRFSRLDILDDINESKAYGFHDFSGFLFVSCWTDLAQESIPQWEMYADKKRGVMISLPRDFFPRKKFVAPSDMGVTVADNIKFPLSWDQIFTDKYWIEPIFLYENWFGTKVEYIDNIVNMFNKNIALRVNEEGREILNIKGLNDFARFKQAEWEFQSEYRFVLGAFPPLSFPPGGFNNGDFVQEYSSHHVSCVKSRKFPNVHHIDIPIGKALNKATFTLGPCCEKTDIERVQSLSKQYAPHARISASIYTGSIR